MPTLNTNLKLKATTQFTNFDFESMCDFNGVKLGASSTGVYKILCGDADETVEISAYFTLATSDFGISNPKRIRFMYFGFISTENLGITLTPDEGTGATYQLLANKDGLQRSRVAISRSLFGRYWSVKVANIDGADFSVDHIEIAPITLNHGRIA